MSNNVNKCPQCKTIIFGTYCSICKKEINDMIVNNMPDFMKDFFNNPNK